MLVWNVDTCSVVNRLTHYNPIVALSWSPSEPNYIALVRGSTNSPLICFLALIIFLSLLEPAFRRRQVLFVGCHKLTSSRQGTRALTTISGKTTDMQFHI